MTTLSPLSDSKISRKYGSRTLEGKLENKTALQREMGWPMESKRPMVCLPLGMSNDIGGALFRELLPGIFSLPVELIVLGKGSAEFGTLFTELAKERGHRIAILPPNDTSIRKMYAAADMALFLGDPSSFEELTHCLKYGVVPIAPEVKELSDYNPVQETGDSFLFQKQAVWEVFAAVVRAIETYKFPFDWRTIERHGMEKVS